MRGYAGKGKGISKKYGELLCLQAPDIQYLGVIIYDHNP
jgi:hypothetical protein